MFFSTTLAFLRAPAALLAGAALAAGAVAVGAPAATVPAHCVVTDEEIADKASAGTVAYNNKTYYLCCAGCGPAFKKNPARYSKLADLRDDVRATQTRADAAKAKIAKSDKSVPVAELAALKAEVKTLETRLADLKTTIGKVERGETIAAEAPAKPGETYCAIQNSAIPTPNKAKSVAYNNKTYHFCCPGCKAKFESDPARFAKEADEKAAKRAASTTTKS